MRKLLRIIAVIALTAGMMSTDTPPAYASGGSITAFNGSKFTWGYSVGNRTVQLTMTASGNALGPNQCLGGYFDWGEKYGNHFDMRIVMVCRNASSKVTPVVKEPQFWDRWLQSPQKLVMCKGSIGQVSRGTCTGKGSTSMSRVNTSLPNMCSRSWIILPGGSSVYGSGGVEKKCDS